MSDKQLIIDIITNFSWKGLFTLLISGTIMTPKVRRMVRQFIEAKMKSYRIGKANKETIKDAIHNSKYEVTPEIINTLNKSIIKEKIESFINIRLVDIYNMSKKGRPQSVFCLQIAILLDSYLSHYVEQVKRMSKHDRMDIDKVVMKVTEQVGYCKELARKNIRSRHIPTEVITIFSKWYEKHIKVMDDTLSDCLMSADSIQSVVDSTLANCIFFVNEVIDATDECVDLFNGDVTRLLPDEAYHKIDFSKYMCFYNDGEQKDYRF